ncbi:uncharacterized protein [Montipora capricornis]|uniref:uncharacterized protein n=1 Tax=Montipora capricornis TaxID=246305 RepID=UPI0035F17A26
MANQPGDTPAVENLPPPVNLPIQPVNSLPLPSKFQGGNNSHQADMWPKWLRHFERYRIASGLQNKSNQEQVGTFLYAMGDCADDIVKTLNINEAIASFDDVKTALNGYFAARRNIIVERARFNRRRQNPGESVDTFIQDLYRLAENCNHGTLKDELIRDRIIVGVPDDTLSDRLQAKSDLTLADAARISRQAEARKQNRTIVRGVETQNEVDYVSQPRSHNKQQATNNPPARNRNEGYIKEPSKNDRPCFWCGRQSHDRKYCPARDTICNNCNKKGHFQSVCLSKKPYPRKVHAVEEQEEEDILFLGEIGCEENYWSAQIGVNGRTTRLKLDTGAAVTVLSDDVQWLQDVELTKTSQVLCGPGNTQLPVKVQTIKVN